MSKAKVSPSSSPDQLLTGFDFFALLVLQLSCQLQPPLRQPPNQHNQRNPNAALTITNPPTATHPPTTKTIVQGRIIRPTKGSSSSAFSTSFPSFAFPSDVSFALSAAESFDVLIAFSALLCFPPEAVLPHNATSQSHPLPTTHPTLLLTYSTYSYPTYSTSQKPSPYQRFTATQPSYLGSSSYTANGNRKRAHHQLLKLSPFGAAAVFCFLAAGSSSPSSSKSNALAACSLSTAALFDAFGVFSASLPALPALAAFADVFSDATSFLTTTAPSSQSAPPLQCRQHNTVQPNAPSPDSQRYWAPPLNAIPAT